MKTHNGLTVWTTAIPLYFELIAVSSISIMDVFFMSLISDKAVAALGASTQIVLVFTLLIRTLTGGAGALAAQNIGAGNAEKTTLAFMYSMVIAVVFGFIFALALYLCRHHIGLWIGLEGETLNISTQYLTIVGPAFFLLALRSGYTTITAVKGKSKLNLMCALGANAVNIFCNCLFVLGWFGAPQLGVVGVALATALSHGVYLLLIAYFTHGPLQVKFIFPADIVTKLKALTRPVMGIAIPNCGDLLSYSLFQVVIMIIVIRVGEHSVAAYTYAHQAMTYIIIWSYSISQGQSILTAHLVGAKQFDRAEYEIKRSILRSLVVAVPATLFLYLNTHTIFSLFTENTDILNLASSAILAYIGIEIGRGFNATLSFSLAAANDARYPAVLGLIFNWLIGVPIALLLALHFELGLLGALLGVALDELLRSPLNFLRLTSRKWQRKHTEVATA